MYNSLEVEMSLVQTLKCTEWDGVSILLPFVDAAVATKEIIDGREQFSIGAMQSPARFEGIPSLPSFRGSLLLVISVFLLSILFSNTFNRYHWGSLYSLQIILTPIFRSSSEKHHGVVNSDFSLQTTFLEENEYVLVQVEIERYKSLQGTLLFTHSTKSHLTGHTFVWCKNFTPWTVHQSKLGRLSSEVSQNTIVLSNSLEVSENQMQLG